MVNINQITTHYPNIIDYEENGSFEAELRRCTAKSQPFPFIIVVTDINDVINTETSVEVVELHFFKDLWYANKHFKHLKLQMR